MTETTKITKDEVIEALIEEMWDDLSAQEQELMINEWLNDTGFELESQDE